MNPDIQRALERAEGAVLCLDTVDIATLRQRRDAFALLTEARSALTYGFPDLALACVLAAQRRIETLDVGHLYRPETCLPAALRAAILHLRTAFPDVAETDEGVHPESVLARLVAQSENLKAR